MIKRLLILLRLPILIVLASGAVHGQTWRPLGPPGGDVHSLAIDPTRPGRLFLGAADGHIFGSQDGGAHWTLLGRVGSTQDGVVTAIVVDPRNADVLFASCWTQDSASGGGVFRSADGGRTWRAAGLAGQAVRALAMASSDPDVLVAGTLDGVYRSRDAANSWERISPEHHEELRNFDSLAIDPLDPRTIYAGTFHLPWKTTDGGRTWHAIHNGMIDDSDVMSFLVDRETPGRIYSSACSGIYRSENAAGEWKKIQGIPYTARRTYVITQDPRHPSVVYAATSEGLWKTSDAGAAWHRTTPQDWVINAVVVVNGQPGRVVIGTEQLGVLASDDEGEHFRDANDGFFHRQILAVALDPARPGRVLAVLAHAPEPVVATDDGGKSWEPLGPGLRMEAMRSVYASPDGWWASLARGGLMRYDAQKKSWVRAGVLAGEAAAVPAAAAAKGGTASQPEKRAPSRTPSSTSFGASRAGRRQFDLIVNDMAFSSGRWFAATENGLLESTDHGETWSLRSVGPLSALPVQSVRVSANAERMWVVSLRGLVFSFDGGASWSWHDLPLKAGGAISLAADSADEKILIAIAHNGLYISRDAGFIWQQAGSGLPSTPVQDLAVSGNIFLASMRTGGLFISSDTGRSWKRLPGALADGYFPAVTTDGNSGFIYAASATDGLYAVEWGALGSANELTSGAPRN